MADLFTIFVAAIGFGAGGEGIRRYRAFKNKRRETPYAERNSGFWTDRKLYASEAILSAAFLAAPWSGILYLLASDRPIGVFYLALLTYPVAIYLFMRNMNAREPQ